MSESFKKNVSILEVVDVPNAPQRNPRTLLEQCQSPLTANKLRAKLTRTMSNEEIVLPEPTFSDRFMRYLVLVIYLGGLSSLGFFLSIYYIFFWDSRMPPVYKPTKKTLFPKL